jgi:hypothetical protein
MKYFIILILAVILSSCIAQKNRGQQWIQLFNGKDLNDWRIKIRGYPLNENFGNTYHVEDGKIKVSYEQYGDFEERFGHMFYKVPYSYYIVAVEYRFIGDQATKGPAWAFRNSGIMLHCQSPESMGLKQDFPISIEVQLLGGRAEGNRTTANLCTPGTNVVMNEKLITAHCVNSNSETFRGDQWVRVEVMVLGDSVIKHIINKDTVLSYEKPQIGGGNVLDHDPMVKVDGQLLESGYISLQSESHPVEFRKVELLNLESKYRSRRKERTSAKREGGL